MSDARLATFLYLLMRDHVPTGVVTKVMQDVDELDARNLKPTFSNPELEAMAARYAESLR